MVMMAEVMAYKRADPFYRSSEWRHLRAAIVRRDGFKCVVCGADVSASGAATVDHIKPRLTHPHLSLDPANLRTLCGSRAKGGNGCDNQSHREKATGAPTRDERFVIRGVDPAGWPIDPARR